MREKEREREREREKERGMITNERGRQLEKVDLLVSFRHN